MRGKITIDQRAPNFVASSTAKIGIDLDGDDRLILVARFIERFRQLSLLAARAGRSELGLELRDIAGCLDRMSYDISVSDAGPAILSKALRVVDVVERSFPRDENPTH